MQQKPPCEVSGLLFLIVPKPGDSLKKKAEKTDEVNYFFKIRKVNSRHAGVRSEIYQKKKRVSM